MSIDFRLRKSQVADNLIARKDLQSQIRFRSLSRDEAIKFDVAQKQGADFIVASRATDGVFMALPLNKEAEWQPVSTAPFDCDLELAVIDYDGVHSLVFPCRRIINGWLKAATQQRIDLRPTHWRRWEH